MQARFIEELQPEFAEARNTIHRKIVSKPISNKVPMLVISSMKDYVFSEKIALGIGKYYKGKMVVFPQNSYDMMLDPN